MDARLLKALAGLVLAMLSICYAAPASAQATRTWVSGVGDDANPCSRTAPCKTFPGAISKTAAGGEINCLDPGGFGGVTITKSISILCQVEAGVLVSGTNGIIINAGVNDVVVLKGLDIEGVGTGLNGVRILQAGSVYVLDSTISDFRGANGTGISFQPPNATAALYVNNTFISNNGPLNQGAGILIQPTGNGNATVSITNSVIQGQGNLGIRVDTTGNATGGSIKVSVTDTTINGNASGIIAVAQAASPMTAKVTLNRVTSSNQSGFGVAANGSNGQVVVTDSTINGNGTGLLVANSGVLTSFGNNHVINNTTNGSFTNTVPES